MGHSTSKSGFLGTNSTSTMPSPPKEAEWFLSLSGVQKSSSAFKLETTSKKKSAHHKELVEMMNIILIHQRNPYIKLPERHGKQPGKGRNTQNTSWGKSQYNPNGYCSNCKMIGHTLEICNAKNHFCSTCKILGHYWVRCPQNPKNQISTASVKSTCRIRTQSCPSIRRRHFQENAMHPTNNVFQAEKKQRALPLTLDNEKKGKEES